MEVKRRVGTVGGDLFEGTIHERVTEKAGAGL